MRERKREREFVDSSKLFGKLANWNMFFSFFDSTAQLQFRVIETIRYEFFSERFVLCVCLCARARESE